MEAILVGAIAAMSLVAALFFLRYWKSTRDRFFLFFALSFFIEAANRVALYETDILTLMHRYGIDLDPLFQELEPHPTPVAWAPETRDLSCRSKRESPACAGLSL